MQSRDMTTELNAPAFKQCLILQVRTQQVLNCRGVHISTLQRFVTRYLSLTSYKSIYFIVRPVKITVFYHSYHELNSFYIEGHIS